MGVYGLWRLLDTSGKPVPLEGLEGKVLAIDISIWIYQVLQGYQDHRGASKPNAHLLGLFTRICKLLYYKIKPVFVFDGSVPMLKKNTIASRRKQKSIATTKAQKMKTNLINNLIKHSVVKRVLDKDVNDKDNETTQIVINVETKRPEQDIFALPDILGDVHTHTDDNESDSDVSIELSPRKRSKWIGNIHNVDITTNEFKALPADVRYDILTDLRETRKQNSWGRLHEMPEESQEFSGFQMKRLLKRRHVQESLEAAEKEMGGKTLTLEELNKLLTEQGINLKDKDTAFRIASDNITRLIYINDKNAKNIVDNALETDKNNELENKNEEIEPVAGPSKFTDQNAKNIDNALRTDQNNEFLYKNKEVEPITGPSNFIDENAKNVVENASETDKNELRNKNEEVEPVAGPSNPIPIVENMNEYALNDDSDDDFGVPTSDDNTTFIMDNINKYMFDTDWESQTNTNESQLLVKNYFGKSKKNPALSYMLEYTGLSQEQIMRLIKYDKDKSLKIGSKSTEMLEKDIYLKLMENIMDDKPVSPLPENYKQVSKSANVQNIRKTVELISSSSESDSFIECKRLKKNNGKTSELTAESDINSRNKTFEKSPSSSIPECDDVKQINASDSDSDFIEIQDVPIPDVDISKTIAKKENIEITIKSDEKLEDDIFADVFEEVDKNKITCETTSRLETVKFTGVNDEDQTILPPENNNNNLKDCSLDTVREEPIQKINMKPLENTRLDEDSICFRDEDKVYNSQNFNVLIDYEKDDDSQIEINPCNERVKEIPIIPFENEEDLLKLKKQLEDEQEDLTKNIGKLERQATNISDQIRVEAQELLRLFGIPYVVAPMEAEAQCAYLEQIKLTDGTITDDSDIWLFGGQCVYKNFFNNNKKVLRFQACDIQHHFKLTRTQLIQLALLVGSDYTIGVTGIGPVTALEILAAFPSEGDNVLRGLNNFCSWIKEGKVAAPGKTGLRNKLRNVKLNRDFPNQAVVQAYLFPTVDESKEKFSWAKPNTVLLCDYARQKFGWTKGKFDDIVIPILRRMKENKNQKLLNFKAKSPPRPIEPSLSKRVQNALRKLNSEDNTNEANVNEENPPKIKKNKKSNANLKSKEEEEPIELDTVVPEPKILDEVSRTRIPFKSITEKQSKEYIPQREKEKACMLEKKLHAIEVFRKSKLGLGRIKKTKPKIRKVKKEAELSESDSD